MKPIYMQERHDPGNGKFGDCFRACIASILEQDIEYVPHVMADMKKDYHDCIDEMRLWLATQGYGFLDFPVKNPGGELLDIKCILDAYSIYGKGLYYILSGCSSSSHDGAYNHSVVCLENNVVHDPSTREKGRVNISGPCKNSDAFWISIIVAGIASADCHAMATQFSEV